MAHIKKKVLPRVQVGTKIPQAWQCSQKKKTKTKLEMKKGPFVTDLIRP